MIRPHTFRNGSESGLASGCGVSVEKAGGIVQIATKDIDIRVDDSLMRVYVAAPIAMVDRNEDGEAVADEDGAARKYPGILLFSEIFQLTAPIKRSVERLAGYGFVVAAPEIYHRIEPVGTSIAYDDIGRMRGSEDARRTSVAAFDADTCATFDYLGGHSQVAPGQLGTMGFCIGGHLAMRAALQPHVKAGVCCYPTGVHNGRLGQNANAGTLERLGEIKGELLVVFGGIDPHVPAEGRKVVTEALENSGVTHEVLTLPAEHAFMRDEGPRYDSERADAVWWKATSLFRRVLVKDGN